MPYIESEADRRFCRYIAGLLKFNEIEPDGRLNCLLYTTCVSNVKPGYVNYRNYVAELRACATEIERRLLAPYEDKKIKENGDIV